MFSAYPSSHPIIKPIYFYYDIEQLFDSVETAKVAAILRMVEYEIGTDFMWRAIGVILIIKNLNSVIRITAFRITSPNLQVVMAIQIIYSNNLIKL